MKYFVALMTFSPVKADGGRDTVKAEIEAQFKYGADAREYCRRKNASTLIETLNNQGLNYFQYHVLTNKEIKAYKAEGILK